MIVLIRISWIMELLKGTWKAERGGGRAFPSWMRFLFSAFLLGCSGWLLSRSGFSSHS